MDIPIIIADGASGEAAIGQRVTIRAFQQQFARIPTRSRARHHENRIADLPLARAQRHLDRFAGQGMAFAGQGELIARLYAVFLLLIARPIGFEL